jgi:ribosomal protein RSM22 (predicted rRNA methylase)
MRLIIPKSQGKQEYYDARKSSWGDLFPHPPKNDPVERFVKFEKNGSATVKGADIGKRGNEDKRHKSERHSYEAISKNLKEERRKLRREKAYAKHEW